MIISDNLDDVKTHTMTSDKSQDNNTLGSDTLRTNSIVSA